MIGKCKECNSDDCQLRQLFYVTWNGDKIYEEKI